MWLNLIYLIECIPRAAHEVPGVLVRNMLGDGHAGVDPLDVLEGLVGVGVDGCLGRCWVEGEEAWHWAVQPVAVEVVAGEVPLREQDRYHGVAKHTGSSGNWACLVNVY